MTREDFVGVVERIKELWPSPSFLRDWNGANQEVTFKKLSTFAQHEVLDCLENHRYDNPDAREPKFSEVAAKLWIVRKARAASDGKGESTSLPSWPTIKAWSDRKSDGDLDHLWQIVERLYSGIANVHDNLWPGLHGSDRRSGPYLTAAWAVEHDVELTFKRGSDEWHAAMDGHDRMQRDKELGEYKRNRPHQLATEVA